MAPILRYRVGGSVLAEVREIVGGTVEDLEREKARAELRAAEGVARACHRCWGEGTVYELGSDPRASGCWVECPHCDGGVIRPRVLYGRWEEVR